MPYDSPSITFHPNYISVLKLVIPLRAVLNTAVRMTFLKHAFDQVASSIRSLEYFPSVLLSPNVSHPLLTLSLQTLKAMSSMLKLNFFEGISCYIIPFSLNISNFFIL